MLKRIVRILLILFGLLLIALVGGAWWAHRQIAGSLPQLDGNISVSGISAPVVVDRDALGIPTIKASSRTDLAYATGFVHAQDRFFQMDLLRRNSAGELSELIGEPTIGHDEKMRIHRFRHVARQRLAIESKDSLELLEAYTKGVNAGLKSLKKVPFEYMALGAEPAQWKTEDSMLVAFSMFLDLQSDQPGFEIARGVLHDLLSQEMFDFLMARGSSWDAPIQGDAMQVPPVPGPEHFDAAKLPPAADKGLSGEHLPDSLEYSRGSNNWAVSGKHTADGRALIADDMHLGLQIPHIWYRASFVWPDESGKEQRITGVTLPGVPAMIVGSNGHIAWGFTNTEGDWADVVIVELDSNNPGSYRSPEGPKKFEILSETIKVKGQADKTLEVVSTIWGPIFGQDHKGRPLALRWVAHDPEGVNLGLQKMESARTLEDALQQANLCGAPHQNFVVADCTGRIAWTVLGRIPRRVGHDGWLPRSWADGTCRWDGYLQPEEYPRIVDPEVGRLWTANARVVSGEFYKIVGDSGYDVGARQQQIRDRLLELERATEADMLKIQLDDRALFLTRWQALLVEVLEGAIEKAKTPASKSSGDKSNPATGTEQSISRQRELLLEHVRNWGARASIDSVGYRAVWQFRQFVFGHLSDLISRSCQESVPDFSLRSFRRLEGPLWEIISQRPQHFLDPRFESWDACLLASADKVIEDATKGGASIDQYTWGRLNTTKIQHPLSKAVPAVSQWLDMPAQPLPGGFAHMPRIQTPDFGASQRMAVSPGKEQDGYMHIPCGQSGHPLSPHYSDSHAAWAEGKPSPFLPGPAIHTLKLQPAASQ